MHADSVRILIRVLEALAAQEPDAARAARLDALRAEEQALMSSPGRP